MCRDGEEGEEEEIEAEGGEMDQWLQQQELQVLFFVWKANLETPKSESPRRKKERKRRRRRRQRVDPQLCLVVMV
jgi:hypothetical protein